MTSCAVCKKEFKNVHGLAIHTARSHKTTPVLAPAPAPAPALTVEELVKKAFEEFRLSHNFDDLLSKMNTKTKTYAETAAAPAPVPAPVPAPAPAPPTPPESVSERRGNASLDFIFKRLGVSSSCDMWWVLKDCYLNFPERFEINNVMHVSGEDTQPHINISYKLPTWKKTICYQNYHLYIESNVDGTITYKTFTTTGMDRTPLIIAVFRY